MLLTGPSARIMVQRAGSTPHTRRLGLFCLVGTVALSLPALFSPLLGSLSGIASPVPISIAFLLGGTLLGLLVAGAAGLTLGIITGKVAVSIFFIIQTGLTGALIAAGIRKRLPFLRIVILVTGLILIALMAGALFSFPGSLTTLSASIPPELDEAFRYMSAMGDSESGSMPVLTMDQFHDIAMALFPGLLVIATMINSLLCMLITVRVASRYFDNLPALVDWELPDMLIWGFIPLAFVTVFNHRAAYGIPTGLVLVLSFLYMIQGIAIVLDLAEKRKTRLWIRYFVAFFILLQPFFLSIFLIVGLLDFRFDFRNRKSRRSREQ